MKRIIVQYKIITGLCVDVVCLDINQLIESGWELHGDLQICHTDGMLIQPLVKCMYT